MSQMTIDELVEFIQNNNIDTYAGWVGGLYGVYSSYQQAETLKRIESMFRKVLSAVKQLAQKMNALYEERTIDDAIAKGTGAVVTIGHLDDMQTNDQRFLVLRGSILAAAEAVAKVSLVSHPAYAPAFMTCASYELQILTSQCLYFPNLHNELLDGIARNSGIADSFLDEIPKHIEARFGRWTLTRDEIFPPGCYHYRGGYYLDGEFIEVLDRERGGGRMEEYRHEVRQAQEAHKRRLLDEANVDMDRLRACKQNWHILKRQNLRIEPKTISLRADGGQYVVAEGGGGEKVLADRQAIGSWELFRLVELDSKKVALRANNGQYVVAEKGGGGAVLATSNHILGWETFDLVDQGSNKIALRSSNGQFVSAENGGGRELVADRGTVGPWEQFELINH